MDGGGGEELVDQLDLGERGAVEMAHAARPDRPQHARIGIALDGIKDIARKGGDEMPRRVDYRRRAEADQRFRRPHRGDDGINGGENNPRRRAGSKKAGLCHRTILHNAEATSSAGGSGAG